MKQQRIHVFGPANYPSGPERFTEFGAPPRLYLRLASLELGRLRRAQTRANTSAPTHPIDQRFDVYGPESAVATTQEHNAEAEAQSTGGLALVVGRLGGLV